MKDVWNNDWLTDKTNLFKCALSLVVVVGDKVVDEDSLLWGSEQAKYCCDSQGYNAEDDDEKGEIESTQLVRFGRGLGSLKVFLWWSGESVIHSKW